MNNSPQTTIPKRIFIVPYRNRIQHKFFFSKYMSFLLEDNKDNTQYYQTELQQLRKYKSTKGRIQYNKK